MLVMGETICQYFQVLGWANGFVQPTGYVAGTDSLTLADLTFAATYSTIVATANVGLSTYTDLATWFDKVIFSRKNMILVKY